MKDLTLHELEQGMTRLMEGANAAQLALLLSSAIYQATLAALLAKIRALPEELRGRPVALLLKENDVVRDKWLRAICLLVEAMRICPKQTEATVGAAYAVVHDFALSLGDVNDTYAENDSKATAHTKHLNTHAATLAAVSTPDGGTLAEWFEEFIAAGKKSGDLLYNRSEKLAEVSQRTEAGRLRSECIGMLGEFRTVVRREVDQRPELPRTLEQELFGMFDTLQMLAEQRNQNESPVPAS